MGDVNNGVRQVDLPFKDVHVHPTDTVTINYVIVHSGYKRSSEVVTEPILTELAYEPPGCGAQTL